MVISIQGTQACSDELVVTGTSEETPEGTQDTQAGSHEMVVTGVKRKAVETVTSTSLPLAERRESVEEAGVGSDIVLKELCISSRTSTFRQKHNQT